MVHLNAKNIKILTKLPRKVLGQNYLNFIVNCNCLGNCIVLESVFQPFGDEVLVNRYILEPL